MSNLAYSAMVFAREVHKEQFRKYTGNPYADHLAEVAGIVAAAGVFSGAVDSLPGREVAVAVAWLHDCAEDQGVTHATLQERFGLQVADAVLMLSDLEKGNRSERKSASRDRLAQAQPFVQSIKCADLLSNTSSILLHDPKFAVVYLQEKRLLLDVMTKPDPRLKALVWAKVSSAEVFEASLSAACDPSDPGVIGECAPCK